MSYYVTIDNFRRWLNRAQTALVSKNKVRKDLWTDFTEILIFEQPIAVDCVIISQTNYTTIATFLQTEGRGDSLKDDSILNWVTTLHELRRILNEEIHFTAKTRTSSEVEERKYQVVQQQPSNNHTQPQTTSSGVTSSQTAPQIHSDTAVSQL